MVGTPHGIVFARSLRRVPKEDSGKWHAVEQQLRDLRENYNLELHGEVVNRVQLDVQAAIPERQAPPPPIGEQLSRRVYIRRSVELARYGYTDRCIGCQHARLGLTTARSVPCQDCQAHDH